MLKVLTPAIAVSHAHIPINHASITIQNTAFVSEGFLSLLYSPISSTCISFGIEVSACHLEVQVMRKLTPNATSGMDAV